MHTLTAPVMLHVGPAPSPRLRSSSYGWTVTFTVWFVQSVPPHAAQVPWTQTWNEYWPVVAGVMVICPVVLLIVIQDGP
jgi:hypothetical protein